MKKLMSLAGVLLLVSCATQQVVFDPNKVSAYLAVHRDRPAPITSALSSGKLCKGMNEKEVQLCWGKPDKINKVDASGEPIVAWVYLKQTATFTSTPWGQKWTRTGVVTKQVLFSNGVVVAWDDVGPSK